MQMPVKPEYRILCRSSYIFPNLRLAFDRSSKQYVEVAIVNERGNVKRLSYVGRSLAKQMLTNFKKGYYT